MRDGPCCGAATGQALDSAMAPRTRDIAIGDHVFLLGQEEECGAVRDVLEGERLLVVDIENAGDFQVPFDAIADVIEQKVVLDPEGIDGPLKAAIARAHEAEDYPPRDTAHPPPDSGAA